MLTGLSRCVDLEHACRYPQLGSTMIYVTHDQVEAMTMGDRICILRDGLTLTNPRLFGAALVLAGSK